jgi:hypothetical protein
VPSSTIPGWLRLSAGALGALILAGAVALVGCGSSSSSASKLSLSISEQGKAASFTLPKSAKGGLVDVSFQNKGKAPHGVQFIQYTGNHTSSDVLKQLGTNSPKTPDWIRGLGGVPSVPGGQSGSATVNLPTGNYVVLDAASLGGPGTGPPATAPLKVTSGDTGDLPSTDGTVKAASQGKDKYAWDISGLKKGVNEVTFDSEGSDALHLIAAVPLKGDAPPDSQIVKDLAKGGPPPAYVDAANFQSTPILDGGKSQTLTLNLKPGKYLFFCPITDRDGGKPHDQEGLLKTVTVK